jgi:hypothetical protein
MMPRLKNKINLPRMVAHSLAYVMYITAWVISMFMTIFMGSSGTQQPYFYLTWLFITLCALISFILFFLILWHLGTKEKLKCVFSPEPARDRSDSQDFNMQERHFSEFI